MKIIKEGDLSKNEKVLKFECERCGCIFEATDKEFVYADFIEAIYDNVNAKCKCPHCNNIVYLYS